MKLRSYVDQSTLSRKSRCLVGAVGGTVSATKVAISCEVGGFAGLAIRCEKQVLFLFFCAFFVHFLLAGMAQAILRRNIKILYSMDFFLLASSNTWV